MKHILVLFLSLIAVSADAGVADLAGNRISITFDEAPLSEVSSELAARLGVPVEVLTPLRTRRISYHRPSTTAWDALMEIAEIHNLDVRRGDRKLVLRPSRQPVLTLDVKDGELRAITAEIRRQCGIRNILIDPGVTGSGTFLMKDVPCPTAVRIILSTMSLAGDIEPNSVLRIGRRQ